MVTRVFVVSFFVYCAVNKPQKLLRVAGYLLFWGGSRNRPILAPFIPLEGQSQKEFC